MAVLDITNIRTCCIDGHPNDYVFLLCSTLPSRKTPPINHILYCSGMCIGMLRRSRGFCVKSNEIALHTDRAHSHTDSTPGTGGNCMGIFHPLFSSLPVSEKRSQV